MHTHTLQLAEDLESGLLDLRFRGSVQKSNLTPFPPPVTMGSIAERCTLRSWLDPQRYGSPSSNPRSLCGLSNCLHLRWRALRTGTGGQQCHARLWFITPFGAWEIFICRSSPHLRTLLWRGRFATYILSKIKRRYGRRTHGLGVLQQAEMQDWHHTHHSLSTAVGSVRIFRIPERRQLQYTTFASATGPFFSIFLPSIPPHFYGFQFR